eukprot:1160291-Pelagomonas_calceolata.AAC.13
MVSIRESSGSRPHSGHSGHLRWEGFPSHYNLHELGSERIGTGSRQRRWQAAEDRDEDRHSQRSGSTHASTAATTASLASRLATLNFEFDKAPYEASILEGSEYDGSEEADVSGGTVGRAGVGLAGLDSPPRLPLFQPPPPLTCCTEHERGCAFISLSFLFLYWGPVYVGGSGFSR